MGLGRAALSAADKAQAELTAELIEKAMRKALWEDRHIRAGVHRELDYAELDS
ncbi:hypothetical protein SEA_INDYLU_29 [Microbacterium phage IndyLu]|uniref:hypothetical protein n=1 Tax=Microbacterium phage IndyLu TaxID=2885152 RepID=UPI001E6AC3A2|nr:hypothetical protein QDW27_gp29 [Microbacterium phage IndyLu]UDG78731.1 hypothetical protein SEA_INDYLU_29 [Microbacterium phage IndyLu]